MDRFYINLVFRWALKLDPKEHLAYFKAFIIPGLIVLSKSYDRLKIKHNALRMLNLLAIQYPKILKEIPEIVKYIKCKTLVDCFEEKQFHISKNELTRILDQAPNTLNYIIQAASEENRPDALNKLVDTGALDFSKEEFLTILSVNCDSLRDIVKAARSSYPQALNKLTEVGALDFTKAELVTILNRDPCSLSSIAFAAVDGHPQVLNKLADLGALDFTKEEVSTILTKNQYSLTSIAFAAVDGHPKALNKLADVGALDFTKEELVTILNRDS
ncbi:hypothetical protein OAT84_04165, partial [Gammaproteobacteria bacterium]|nr:hypothetical protein [Gammaproteobacteria bacterium]